MYLDFHYYYNTKSTNFYKTLGYQDKFIAFFRPVLKDDFILQNHVINPHINYFQMDLYH